MYIFSFSFFNRFSGDFLVAITLAFQFVSLSTSRLSKYNNCSIVLLDSKIQKFSSILKGLRKYHQKSLFCPFLWFFTKMSLTVFYAPTIDRSEISTDDRARQVLPLMISRNFAPEKSESFLIKSQFFLSFTLYPQFEEFFYDQTR